MAIGGPSIYPGIIGERQFPSSVWLIWVKIGKYGDSTPKVVRSTLELAHKWCADHAQRLGCDHITWDELDGHTEDVEYTLEQLPFK